MASQNPLKILEISQVAPFSNSFHFAAEFSFPLTFYDTFWLNFTPVERLFFYQLTDSTVVHFNSVILPKLKHSLSLTLLHYIPLAGKLTWPPDAAKPIVSYSTGDAVSLIVAESSADFKRLSGDDTLESSELRHLTPQLLTSDDRASSMALQITLFPNQGFCVGITTHHAIVDGSTAVNFMKSWAYLCTQLDKPDASLLPELTPSFDRTVIKDPTGLYRIYLRNWLDYSGSDISEVNQLSLKVYEDLGVNRNTIRATCKLSREDIKKLREKILSKAEGLKPVNQLHLSTFVVTYSYVIICLVKARGAEGNRNVNITFPVDYRHRLDPPIPANYFGNCVYFLKSKTQASALTEENGIAVIAEKISNMIREIDEKGLFEGAEQILEDVMKMEAGDQTIGLAGSIRFNVYGVDFGWGRPKKVEIASVEKTGAVALTEARDGNGVEIGVVLSCHEMEIFKSLFSSGLRNV
ncbi:phenolic glucoside malonyltransferase 1-like [Mangifera indica]|uniref:phenolic glucoside malonyltransferase 1-like n=1 Tax=Mangifera indica TaxID=29780 RepID=UPI001CF950B8|nr:phenolic glucoside malonyltransferase 1-like [Mangifera indica]